MARKKQYTQKLVLPLTDEQMQWLKEEAERMASETGVTVTKNHIARKVFDEARTRKKQKK